MFRTLSNSMRGTFGSCPYRFYLLAVERLVPIKTEMPLTFGRLMHRGMESYYSGGSPIALINEWIADETEHAYQVESPALDEIKKHGELALSIMERYPARYPHDFDDYTVVSAETLLRRRIPTPKGKPSRWWFAGVVDLLLRDKAGRLYIMEHKTTAEANRDKYEISLELDAQRRGYVWLVQECLHEQVYGVIYNVMRKKIPAIPEPIICKRCRGDGVVHTADIELSCVACQGTGVERLSKRDNIDTNADIFRAELNKFPHAGRDDYNQILTRLDARGDTFLYRLEFDVSQRDIDEWIADTYRVAQAINWAKRTGNWFHNYAACNQTARRCPYRHLCLGGDEFTKKELYRTLPDNVELPELENETESGNE